MYTLATLQDSVVTILHMPGTSSTFELHHNGVPQQQRCVIWSCFCFFYSCYICLNKLNSLYGFINLKKDLQGRLKHRIVPVYGGLHLQQQVLNQQLLKGPVPEDVGPGGQFVPASEQLCGSEPCPVLQTKMSAWTP